MQNKQVKLEYMRLDDNTSHELLIRLVQAVNKNISTLTNTTCTMSLESLNSALKSKSLCNVYANFSMPNQNGVFLSMPIFYCYSTSRENAPTYLYEVPKTWSWADIVEDMLEKTVQGIQFNIFGNSLDMSTDSIYTILIDIDMDDDCCGKKQCLMRKD